VHAKPATKAGSRVVQSIMVVFNNVAEGNNHSRLAAYDWSWIDFLAKANRFYGAVLGKEVRTLGGKGISASMIG
jgi:hypothetical protein